MKNLAMIAIAVTLTACSLNPVIAPYAVAGASLATESQVATIWGSANNSRAYFKKINGNSLPSRGGGGYPLSIQLLPGRHVAEIYFQSVDKQGRLVDGDNIIFPVKVEAGRTYVLEHNISPDRAHVSFDLRDLGETRCAYEAKSVGVQQIERLVCK